MTNCTRRVEADERRRPLRAARPRGRGRDRRHRPGGRHHVPRLGDHQPVHRRCRWSPPTDSGRCGRVTSAPSSPPSRRSPSRWRPPCSWACSANCSCSGRCERRRPRQAGRSLGILLVLQATMLLWFGERRGRSRACSRPDRRGARQLDPRQPLLDGRRRGADHPGARRPVPLDPVRAGHRAASENEVTAMLRGLSPNQLDGQHGARLGDRRGDGHRRRPTFPGRLGHPRAVRRAGPRRRACSPGSARCGSPPSPGSPSASASR